MVVEAKEVVLKHLVKMLVAEKKTTITEIAKLSNKSQPNLSNILKKGNPRLSVFKDILKSLGEDLVIVLGSEGSHNLTEIDVKQFFKMLAANANITIDELAKLSGRTQGALSIIMNHGNPNLNIFRGVLEAAGKEFIITLSNGRVYKILETK